MVSAAAAKLGSQASTLGVRHIKDGTLRLQFNREVAYYAKRIIDDVQQGKKSPEQGLKELKDEQNSLLSQSLEVAQKGVGVIAGALQFAAGAGICYASVGTLCVLAGLPLMLHGANNTYENGRNLWEKRSNIQGPIRKGYQAVAKRVGAGEFEGNMAYGAVDVGLSAYGVGRRVLTPDAWRLFRYVRTDYVRGYQGAGKGALTLEAISNTATMNAVYQEAKHHDKEFINCSYLVFTGFCGRLLFFYGVSKKISGPHLTHWKFYIFFALLVLWGGHQLSVARYGYMLLPLPSNIFFESDDVIRWVAFISAVFQVLCVPTQKLPRRWFSRQ